MNVVPVMRMDTELLGGTNGGASCPKGSNSCLSDQKIRAAIVHNKTRDSDSYLDYQWFLLT